MFLDCIANRKYVALVHYLTFEEATTWYYNTFKTLATFITNSHDITLFKIVSLVNVKDVLPLKV